MSWQTRPTFNLYPSGLDDGALCEEPYFIPFWADQPAGYEPLLPLVSAAPGLPVPAAILAPFALQVGKALPNADPTVGAFVQDLPLPAGVLGGFGEVNYVPVDTAPFVVGVSLIGSADAIGIADPPFPVSLP